MKKILLIMLCIVLLAVPIISAEEVFTFDNIKQYDEVTKTVTIVNSFNLPGARDISTIQLNTPLNYKVGLGYQKVAEFEIDLFDDTYTDAFDDMVFINKKNNETINKDFDYKYLTTELYDVNDYDYICYSENIMECSNKIIGTHKEEREVWEDFNTKTLIKGKVTIGIFTNTQQGDYIEWIPTLFGKEIDEWATWTASLNTDLVGYYTFDEPSGNLLDSVGSNDGTLNGPTQGEAGIIGDAYSFANNDNIYINDGSDFSPGAGSFSFFCWVKPANFDEIGGIYWKGLTGNNPLNSIYVNPPAGLMSVSIEGTGDQVALNSVDPLTTGNWQHIGYTFNPVAKTIKIYINGVLNASTTYGGTPGAVSPPVHSVIGSWQVDYRYFDGLIDEAGIWLRELNSAEVIQLYNGGVGITYVGEDTIPPTYSDAQTNTTDAGVSVNFSVLYNDTTALESDGGYIFSTNNTGVWVNESLVMWTSTPEWANVTKTLNSTGGLIIGYRWYANDSAGNNNNTPIYTLTTVDVTPLTYLFAQTNTTEVGEAILFSVLYDDETALNPNGQYIFSTNNTGSWVNESVVNFTATPEWANVTKTLNLTGGTMIGYMWYANDSAGNYNNTDIYVLTTTDTVNPLITITYPTTATYSENISELNYTYIETNPGYCWYSIDSGATNLSVVSMGTNFTNVVSISGSNTWWVYCNDTSNNNVSDSITFTVNKLWYNTGYPFANQSFRISEFINVSGTNFTLGGERYTLQGVDAYYLVDYATNHTYDDNGNEINNSREAVIEILNEASYLNINVIRTWANMQGSADSHWILNESGGHYNLFEVGVPGNYSNQTLEALDWVLYQASQRDIRLQLVLINNWNDYGGMRWYAQKSPTTNKTYEWINDTADPHYWEFHDQFYDDENCRTYYRNYINMLLNRNNTYTNVLYKDDPTIFAWLLANEPRAKSDSIDEGGDGSLIVNWTINMTAYIKSIDTNHLVGLGIEGWGTPFEGTDMIANHNNAGVDFVTFELHPEQWNFFAERSEGVGDASWVTGGINDNDTIDWWTTGTGYSYNNRYEGPGYVPDYSPALARHGYENWVKQNVVWANDLGLPVLLQEVAMPTSSQDAQKDRFFQQTINSFFSNGGDGILYWNLNHDNYYYSTEPDGIMDDGYSFYLSDDLFLENKSESVINAMNFTRYDNGGDSWITELNNYKYDFILNVGIASDTVINNCILYLNVSNGTWSGYYADQSNSTHIVYNEDYTFTKQFESNDEEVYWYTNCSVDSMFVNSSVRHVQIKSATPVISLVSPSNNTYYNNNSLNLFYNVTNAIDISFCELSVDSVLNKTDYTISKDVNQSFSVSGLSEAAHNWSVKCTDVDNNKGFSAVGNFTVDLTPPTFVTIPANTSVTYGQGFGVYFVGADETSFDTYVINWTTLFTINSTGYLENSTLSITVGTYLINVTINDTANNLNSTIYNVTINKAVPTGSLTNTDTWTEPYLESVTIGLSESNVGDGDVIYKVYREGVDKGSGETVTLGVGTYDYVLNTLGGVNWTASVSMDAQTLTVTKISPSSNMDITGTTPIIYPTVSDFSGSETNTGDGGCSYSMDISNGIYGVGVSPVTFEYSTTGCANYTAGDETKNLVINQNTTYTLLITGTNPIGYGIVTDVVGGSCPTELSCSLDKANAIYAVGTETFNYSTPGNINYSEKYITKGIVINRGNLVVSITNSKQNTFTHDGTPANIGISESNTGDGDVTYILWKDGINVGISDAEEDIGTYTYLVNSTGGVNYTSSASLNILTLTIGSKYPDLVKRIAQVLQALIVLSAAIIILFTVRSFYEEERTLGEVIRTSLYVGLGTFILIMLMPIMVSYIAKLIV